MKSYIYLYYNTNKNYFFERFKFLDISIIRRNYLIYFLLKIFILPAIILFLAIKFPNYKNIISFLIFIIFYIKIFNIDGRRWAHFYRNDWLLSVPNDFKRYSKILWSNIIVDTFVKDNILIYAAIQMMYFNIVFILKVYLVYLCIYYLFFTYQLILLQSKIVIKKIYSLIMYVLFSILSVTAVYFITELIIRFVKAIIEKESTVEFLSNNINIAINTIVNFMNTNIDKFILIFVILSVINFIIISMLMLKGKFSNGMQLSTAKINDLYLVKIYYRIISKLKCIKNKNQLLKELSLFVELYSFNYKEYFNTFFIDRSMYFLFGIIIAIYLNFDYIQFIVGLLILLLFYLDLVSGINGKLIANMSFVSDYPSLVTYNMLGRSIKEIVDIKIKFFRIIRLLNFLIYLLFTLIVGFLLKFSYVYTFSICTFLLIFWIVLPKILLLNNLLYVRYDYVKSNKFIEEINLLDNNNEFILTNIFYKVFLILIVLSLVANAFLYDIRILYIVNYVILFILLLFIILESLITKKIIMNICNSIKRGDFSIDVSKIFKK